MKLPEDLETRIFGLKSKGAFSHLYFSCGLVGEKKPRFSYVHLADNKNIFDLASLTKALATAPLVVDSLGWSMSRLNQQTLGDLLKDNNNIDLHPTFCKLKVLDLLSHRSGLPAWINIWTNCFYETGDVSLSPGKERLEKRLNHLAERVDLEPGAFVYSDVGYLLLGWCLELLKQQSLSTGFAELCCKVMGSLGKVGVSFGCLEKEKRKMNNG